MSMNNVTTNNKSKAWELQLKLSAAAASPKSIRQILKEYLHERLKFMKNFGNLLLSLFPI